MPKRIVSALLLVSLSLALCLPARGAEPELELESPSAILMDAATGTVLFEQDADTPMEPASVTKVMTLLLVMEALDRGEISMDDRVVASEAAAAKGGSQVYLEPGEEMSMDEMLKSVVVASANDCATALAEHLAGSEAAFVERMNRRAEELGMTNTHFVTPSGLDHENHYSTAKDMAVLCCYAMRNREFADIVSQKSLTVQFVTPENKQQYCKNHNRLLSMYEGCIGIKTGFTKKAGRTLTSCAERNGVRLLAVTLNAPDDWNDHQRLYDHGFSCTTLFSAVSAEESYRLPVVGGEQNEVIVRPVCGCSLTVRNDADDHTNSPVKTSVLIPHSVDAPIEKGMVLGEIDVYYREKKISSVSLAAAEAIRIQKEEC